MEVEVKNLSRGKHPEGGGKHTEGDKHPKRFKRFGRGQNHEGGGKHPEERGSNP